MSSTREIINGGVPGGKRQERVDRFQAAPDGFDVTVMSPRAGGVGLTLTRANHIIHLDRWWNPAVEDQYTGRALRIGQARTVHVHILIATQQNGQPPFDENRNDLLTRMRQLTRDVLLPGEPDTMDAQDLFARIVGA